MLKSVLKRALGLGTAVVGGARIEGESIIVSARPRRAAIRCPACGRRCGGYDTLPARRWRAPDAGSARCYAEYAPRRAECPEHGVCAEAVPWARAAPSRFTSAFEDTVALRKVRRKREGVLRSIELGVSNGRVEAVNNKIKVAVRQGYGFRNIDNLIALVMLRCSDLRPALPGGAAA